jgi:hypothetical protein
MKKIYAILGIILFAACSPSDDSAPQQAIDPMKLQKIILYPDAPNERQWNFYPNGLLKEVTDGDGNVLQTFVYTDNNLTSGPNAAFTYDSANHITSVNAMPVDYDAGQNTYTIHYPYVIDDPDEYDVLSGITVGLNTDGRIVSESQNFLYSGGAYTNPGMDAHYASGNMVNCYDGAAVMHSYSFDSKINPLKAAMLPICKAMALTSFGNLEGKWALGEFNSANNVTYDTFDGGAESLGFSYTYNANNLPVTQHTQYYYNGEAEGGAILTAQYYYQGDAIP